MTRGKTLKKQKKQHTHSNKKTFKKARHEKMKQNKNEKKATHTKTQENGKNQDTKIFFKRKHQHQILLANTYILLANAERACPTCKCWDFACKSRAHPWTRHVDSFDHLKNLSETLLWEKKQKKKKNEQTSGRMSTQQKMGKIKTLRNEKSEKINTRKI